MAATTASLGGGFSAPEVTQEFSSEQPQEFFSAEPDDGQHSLSRGRPSVPPLGLPPLGLPAAEEEAAAFVPVTDEEREATMRAQLKRCAKMTVLPTEPALAEVRAVCQLALKAKPSPPTDTEVVLYGTVEELRTAIRTHKRYNYCGIPPLLGKSRQELALILANMTPYRQPVKERDRVTSARFLVTARHATREDDRQRLAAERAAAQAKEAAAAARAAERAAAAAAPPSKAARAQSFWEAKARELSAPVVKTAEQLQAERDKHLVGYYKLTDRQALEFAKSQYAAHRF